MNRSSTTPTFIAALALAATAAHAQNTQPSTQPAATTSAPATATTTATTPPPTLTTPDQWTVKIEPQVWYMAPEGKLHLPGSPAGTPAVKLSTLGADDPEASFAGQVTIRVPHEEAHTWSSGDFWKSGWFFSIGGASYSGDGDTTAPGAGFTLGSLTVAGGADVSTSLDWSTFNAQVGKWIAGSDFDSGGTSRIDLYAVAGARIHTQDISVSSGGDTTDASETFGSALLGLRLDVKLPANFAAIVDVNANFWPGDPSTVGFEVAPSFMWRPTDNIGIQIGYRLLMADCESGDDNGTDYYRLDGSLAGLFAGIEIRF